MIIALGAFFVWSLSFIILLPFAIHELWVTYKNGTTIGDFLLEMLECWLTISIPIWNTVVLFNTIKDIMVRKKVFSFLDKQIGGKKE